MSDTKTIPVEEFKDGIRNSVLSALDGYMRDATGMDIARGWRDSDLPALFRAVDAQAVRIAERFNDPESDEFGSAFLSIRMTEAN